MRAIQEPEGPGGPGRLARLAPLVVVLAVLGLAGLLVLSGEGGDADEGATTGAAPAVEEVAELPTGVLPFSVAEELGTVDDIDWGERCARRRGCSRCR